MKSIWNFIKYVVFSYVLLALQDYPDVVLSHIFDILIFPLYFFQFGREKDGSSFFFFSNRKSPQSFFFAPSGYKPTNSCLAVQMMGSISIWLLQSRLLSSDINLILYLYIPHVAFLWYYQRAMTPVTLKMSSSRLHSDFILIGISYTVQLNQSLIIKLYI